MPYGDLVSMEILTTLLGLITSAPGLGVLGGIVTVFITKRVDNVIDKRKANAEKIRLDQEKEKVGLDYGTQLRTELREELKVLKEQIRLTEAEVDEWKGKYFDQISKITITEGELTNVKFKLERTQQELNDTLNRIKTTP